MERWRDGERKGGRKREIERERDYGGRKEGRITETERERDTKTERQLSFRH